MSTPEAQRYLKNQARKFLIARLTEIMLLAFGIGLLTFALLRLFTTDLIVASGTGLTVFVLLLILRIRRTGVLRWNAMRVSLYLNSAFPELKDSTDLLVAENAVTGLEEVQRLRVLKFLDAIKPRVKPPHRIGQGLLVLATGVIAVLLLPAAVGRAPIDRTAVTVADNSATVTPEPVLSGVEVQAVPPAYTGMKAYTIQGANFKVPVNSRLKWSLTFSGHPVSPAIRLSTGDSLALTDDSGNPAIRQTGYPVHASGRATQPFIYQITWRDKDGKRYLSDFYHADVREDAPPVIHITGREQFQIVRPGDPLLMEVNVRASDDYGVRDAHLIATVSKGSGESVKFREVTLTFEGARFPTKQTRLTRPIDLGQLGLEPGDELYFYAEALDNRAPTPNLSRTETFFIALQDTAEAVTVADSGLGIDFMPDYFRSQRQIIIDTEKLLAEQRRIKKQEFNLSSNELGFDQKALRLKYGQFLGMEDEIGIGVVAGPAEEEVAEEEDEDPSKKFGHEHDKENEHNLVDEKKAGKEAGHEHREEEGEEEDPMKAFLHEHDSDEEATFFVQSVKTKLKAALTLMWDSELHLRMYEPKKSLPFQYRILNLLKEIAQDNRAYVHRTGFDAPPIKEERRLTGELDEVSGTTERVATTRQNPFPAIAAALGHIELALQNKQSTLTPEVRASLEQAGYEVAVEALKQPGKYLQTLSSLRRLTDGTVGNEKMTPTMLAVRRDFWSILPVETYNPSRPRRTLHPLDQAALELMEKAHE